MFEPEVERTFHRSAAALAHSTLCFAVLAMSGCAMAAPTAERTQQARQKLHQRFVSADQDGNGQLTRAEAQAGMPRVYSAFDQIDTARKGFVTEAEIAQHAALQVAARRRTNYGGDDN